MPLLAALPIATAQGPSVPTLSIEKNGDIRLEGQIVQPRSKEGVSKVNTPFGIGYDFTGPKNGILFDDLPQVRLSKHITISAYVYPRSFAPNGAQSEIFFRGDDRNGYDPFSLAILSSGDLEFQVTDEFDHSVRLRTPIQINRWTHILASFNETNGEIAMFSDGVKMGSVMTPQRPLIELVPSFKPGLGIGNVQNNKGPHNQQFDGIITDLRVYAKTLTPSQTGFRFTPKIVDGPQP